MLAILFYFIVTYLLGSAIIKLLGLEISGAIKLVVSLVIGTIITCLLLFGMGFVLAFNKISVGILLIIIGGIGLIGNIREIKLWLTGISRLPRRLLQSLFPVTKIIIPALFLLLIIWLFGRSLLIGPQGQIIAGDRLVWVDWPLHIGMAANFAWGQNFPPQNPTFANYPLVYPFFADFLSGVLWLLSGNIVWAFMIPGIILTTAFFWIFVKWVFEISDKSLKSLKLPIGWSALFLSLFWGGLGWFYWLQEAFKSETNIIETLLMPPREYTFWSEKGLWFFTFLYSEILPQRAFLFGLPIFFLILYLAKKGWDKRDRKATTCFILAGILAGILPFFHTHSFLSLVFLSVTFTVLTGLGIILWQPLKQTLLFIKYAFWFFLPFVVLALIQYPLLKLSFGGWPFEFGWLKGNENFFLFWFKNTGFFIPLYFLGLWKGGFGNFGKMIGVSAWILFILPNLFRFAPWGYDNLKILTYWYLIGSVFVASALVWVWQTRLIRPIGKIIAVLLFFSLTLSGMVEVGRIMDTKRVQIGLWSKQDQELAENIKAKTPPQAVFLAAAIHDHPVVSLAGRKIVIGYPGNSWSWGLPDWNQREQDVHVMFKGGETAKSLWKKYGIDYIIVSDRERWNEKQLNEDFIAKNTELFLTEGTTKIYKIIQLSNNPIIKLSNYQIIQ